MQYLLTKEEFDELKFRITAAEVREKDKVQKLCTLVASFKPVPRPWEGENACNADEYHMLHNGEVVHDVYCSNCGIKYHALSI